MFEEFKELFGGDFSKSEEVLEFFKNILQGQLVISEDEVNQYIENNLHFKDDRVKDVYIKIKDDLLSLEATVKSKKTRSAVNIEAIFELKDWNFKNGDYYLEFELVNDPEYNVEGNLAKYLSGIIGPIIEKMINSESSDIDILEEDLIEYKNRKLYIRLDRHEKFKNVIDKEITFANQKIRPIDYIDITDIQLKDSRVIISPLIQTDEILKDYL